MLTRSLFLLGLLAASVGVPYAATTSPDLWKQAKARWAAVGTSSPGDELTYTGVGGSRRTMRPGQPTAGSYAPTAIAPLEGMPAVDLADVLRMDISPTWVYRRWARKSTQLAELELHGIRVPLVTGTSADDLAGALTYYFNGTGQVQRISFRGRTGDASRLVALVSSQYGLRLQQTGASGEQLYQLKWNGRAQSELRIRPAAVMWAGSPHANFEVELELERPGSGRYLNRTTARNLEVVDTGGPAPRP